MDKHYDVTSSIQKNAILMCHIENAHSKTVCFEPEEFNSMLDWINAPFWLQTEMCASSFIYIYLFLSLDYLWHISSLIIEIFSLSYARNATSFKKSLIKVCFNVVKKIDSLFTNISIVFVPHRCRCSGLPCGWCGVPLVALVGYSSSLSLPHCPSHRPSLLYRLRLLSMLSEMLSRLCVPLWWYLCMLGAVRGLSRWMRIGMLSVLLRRWRRLRQVLDKVLLWCALLCMLWKRL